MEKPTLCAATVIALGLILHDRLSADDRYVYLGPGNGTLIHTERPQCGQLLINSDETYEASFNWAYGGVVPPYYGAFAECYEGRAAVCSVVLDLTTSTGRDDTFDAYVWDDAGGTPGSVRCLRRDVATGPVAGWPDFSRHIAELPEGCCTEGVWWVGFWPNWPGEGAAWYIGADVTYKPGCPFTNIAPGIGFPTGWHHVSSVFGPHQSLGIGAEVRECAPTPVIGSTWGSIKSLYK